MVILSTCNMAGTRADGIGSQSSGFFLFGLLLIEKGRSGAKKQSIIEPIFWHLKRDSGL